MSTRPEFYILYRPGQPCKHRGCLSHVSHPCEACGRVSGGGYVYGVNTDVLAYTDQLQQERDELEEANSILYDSMMRTAEQRNRAKEDLTALKAENEKARDNLNDLAETIDQFIKCPESKAARRVLINAQSFLKGAQDESKS